MEFVGWYSPAGSKRAAAFAIRRKVRARGRAIVSAAMQTRFRPRQRNKGEPSAPDRLVWQRRLSSTPARTDRQRQTPNGKRNSRWPSTFGDYPSNRDKYRPKENSELLRSKTDCRNSANARASSAQR